MPTAAVVFLRAVAAACLALATSIEATQAPEAPAAPPEPNEGESALSYHNRTGIYATGPDGYALPATHVYTGSGWVP